MAPPPLPDDVIPDILLRLPPDDPAGLVRASAVCKAWHRIITDPAFHGSYRALHPTPPVLGFLQRPKNPELPRFVSTTSFRPAAADYRQHPLDCRHGRAVFYDYGSLDFNGVLGGYIVCDPVTGELHNLPDVPDVFTRPAVVCAASGDCDNHRSCSGGPFMVAFVGMQNIPASYYFDAHACFYASDTRRWSLHLNIHLDHGRYYPDDRPAALLGDSLYFYCRQGILRYRYGLLRRLGGIRGMISAGIGERDILSMMELPKWKRLGIGKSTSDVVVMAAEGGGLGLACLGHKTRTMLYLFARDTEGAVGDDATVWVQRRVIDLKMLLPVGNNPKWQP